ncbi:hypothetical protein DPMN_047223 [Dreissena polymorpha]|uniref:Uncharacterized protein n=1 Tax=Dreissena polymorpha TaxID=45954 RepID=A0A9D4D9B7_DREPO|nr:hypothetical protein DPMN_047223 [Dreissena polymorpha]
MYADNVDLSSVDCQEQFSKYFDSLKCSEVECSEIEACSKSQSDWVILHLILPLLSGDEVMSLLLDEFIHKQFRPHILT